jgi:hypothetical protein
MILNFLNLIINRNQIINLYKKINEDITINLFEENEFIINGRIDSSYNYNKSKMKKMKLKILKI